jgi:hypothetical protein
MRTNYFNYYTYGDDEIDLSDPPSIANLHLLLNIVTDSYLADNDDVTSLATKNPRLANIFSYAWNYTKVGPYSTYANNTTFLVQANITQNGSNLRFVDYLATPGATVSPFNKTTHTNVVTNDIQNITPANNPAKKDPRPDLTRAFYAYYVRRWKNYARFYFKTPILLSTGQYNFIQYETHLINTLN